MDDANLRVKITRELELRSRDVKPQKLSDFIDDVESYLLLSVRSELMAMLCANIVNARASNDGNSIQIKGDVYFLDISEYVSGARSTIRIHLRPAAPQRGRWRQVNARVKIDGYGHFSGLSISAPTSLFVPVDLLARVTKAIYDSGYQWLLEFCKSALTNLTDKLSMELYGYLRRIFSGLSNPALAGYVYLGVVDPSGVIYLFDQLAAEKVVTVFQEGKTLHPLSPLVLSAELLTSVVNFDESFNKEAIEHGDALDVDLSDAKYLEEQPIYDVAERALLGTTGVSFFPITAVGGQYLSCWFPTSLRPDVLPVMKEHRAQFGEIFRKHRSRVRRIWKSSLNTVGGDFLIRLGAKLSAEFIKEWFHVH